MKYMKKINLFYILSHKKQTYLYEKRIGDLVNLERQGLKKHSTTLEDHFFMLSKYFNLYNFYRYKNKIQNFENAVIYHLPQGKDFKTGVEDNLIKFKNKVPIINTANVCIVKGTGQPIAI